MTLPEEPAGSIAAERMSCADLKEIGDAAFRRQAYDEAVAAYTSALARLAAEQHADRHMQGTIVSNRCLARLKMGGQAGAALADAEEACRLRPRWGKAHLRLAQVQSEEACGRPDAAAASYRRAAELDDALASAVAKALAVLERQASRQRCLAVLQGHQGAIYDAALHPEAQQLGSISTSVLVTGGADASLRVWCLATGCQLQQLGGHSDVVTCLRWSPCGALLASGSLDGTARLWRLASRLTQCSSQQGASGAPPSGGSTAAGTATGSQGSPRQQATQPPSIHLQLLVPGPVLSGHSGRVSCLAFSPDGSRLATGSSDGQVWLWSTGDGSCLQKLSGHSSLTTAVCFSPCGQLLASASGDGLCKVWSTAAGGASVAEIAWDSGPVNFCTFVPVPNMAAPQLPGGNPAASQQQGQQALLLTCHVQQQRREGRILLWDVVQRRQGWVDGKLCGPAATLDGFRGKVCSIDSWCAGVDASNNKASFCDGLSSMPQRSSSSGATAGGSAIHGADPWVAGMKGAAEAVLAAACTDGSVKVYDLAAIAGAAAAATPGPASTKAATAPLFELLLPEHGSSASWQQSAVPAWSAASLQQAAHDRNLLAFSPDGRLLAVVGPDSRILLVDVESGQQQLALAGHRAAVRTLRWLPPGSLLSAGEDGVARLWDTTQSAAAGA